MKSFTKGMSKMNKNSFVKVTPTEDLQALEVSYGEEMSYQDAIAMSNAIVLNSVSSFLHHSIEDVGPEHIEGVREAVYDDLNMRFTNLLNTIIPEDELGIDFTAEAQQALNDENEYIELKFKANAYDQIVQQAKETTKTYVKLNIKNGELDI